VKYQPAAPFISRYIPLTLRDAASFLVDLDSREAELSVPQHRDVVITTCGRLCLHRERINISIVLAGQKLGIKEVDDGHLARQLHAL
jgi:hypothetical protein